MKTWRWFQSRTVHLVVAVFLSLPMGTPSAFAAYSVDQLRQADTDASGTVERQIRGDNAWVWGPGGQGMTALGRSNLVGLGKEIVSAAFNEGRAFPLVGPGARPVNELVEPYAIGYRRRFGKALPEAEKTALTQRLERVKAALERSLQGKLAGKTAHAVDVVRFAPILNELGAPALVTAGVSGTPTHQALVAYGGEHAYSGWEDEVAELVAIHDLGPEIYFEMGPSAKDQYRKNVQKHGPKSVYPSLEQIEGLIAQGDEGLQVLGMLMDHEIGDVMRGRHEDESREVEDQVNAAIGNVFEQVEQKNAEARAAVLKAGQEAAKKEAAAAAKRVQIVPYLIDLGQFFEDNRPPAYVLRAIEARLEQAAREGQITDSRVKPLGNLAMLEIHYNGSQRNPAVDRLIVDLVTEVIARDGQRRATVGDGRVALANGAVEDATVIGRTWEILRALAGRDVRSFRELIRKSRDPYYVLDEEASDALRQVGLLVNRQIHEAVRNLVLSSTEALDPFNPRETFRLPDEIPMGTPVQMRPGAQGILPQLLDTLSYDERAKRLLQGPSGNYAFDHGGSEPVYVSVALGGGPAAFNWPVMRLLDEAVQNQLKIEGIRSNELKALQAGDQKKDKETMEKILELEQELQELRRENPLLKADQDKAAEDLKRLQELRKSGASLEQALEALVEDLAKEAATEGPGYVVQIERVSDILAGKRDRTAYRFVYPRSAPYIHTLVDDQTEWVITKVLPRPGSRRYNVNKSPEDQDPMLVVMVDPPAGVPTDGRSLNPILVGLQQSGFPAVGEFNSATTQFYITTAGSGEGAFHRGMVPVTAEEADNGAFADRGLVRLVSDAYMSYGTTRRQDKPGLIPHAEVHDQVGMSSDIKATREQKLWVHDEFMMMGTFQPAVTAPEAERRAHAAVKALGPRYHEIPHVIARGPDGKPLYTAAGKPIVKVDPLLEASNKKAAVTVSVLKADTGATGHQVPYAVMYAAFRASFNLAKKHGLIKDYDVGNAGDDNHFVLFHDRGVDDPEIHALAFTTFFRAGWLIHQLGYQLYGDMQDFVDEKIKEVIKERELHRYAKLDDEFMAELKKEMEWVREAGQWDDVQAGYDKVKQGISSGTIVELRAPGNVAGMGIGFTEKAFSKEELERFGYAAIGANDKAASGEFNFGIYWALRLSTLLRQLGGDVDQVRAALEQEVAKNEPHVPAKLRWDDVQQEKVSRLIAAFQELKAEDGAKFADWTKHGLVVETWDVAPGSRAFVDVEHEDDKLLPLLSAQNEHNIKRIWVKKRSGWIQDLSEEEVRVIERRVDEELRANRGLLVDRKTQLHNEVGLFESSKGKEGRSAKIMTPWERMLLSLPIDADDASPVTFPAGDYVGKEDTLVMQLRPRLIEYSKVREFLSDDYILSASTEKLAQVTHGAYVGKDDSVFIALEPFAALYRGVAKRFVRVNVGNARGSHWVATRIERTKGGAISKAAVAMQWSNPIEIGFRFSLNPDGTVAARDAKTELPQREDMYEGEDADAIRQKVSDFNLIWIQTQGGFTPHGPNVFRDVEAAYPARQTLLSLIKPDSPFAFRVDDATLTTIQQGKWGPGLLGAADYSVSPELAEKAADLTGHRWVVIDSRAFTAQGPGGAITLERVLSQLRAILRGGRSSVHVALAVDHATTAQEAEAIAGRLFQAIAEGSGQTARVIRDYFNLVVPANIDPDKLLGLLEAASPGSRLGSVLGDNDWARALAHSSEVAEEEGTAVGIFGLGSAEEGRVTPVGNLVVAAFEAAVAGGRVPQPIAAKLKVTEIDGIQQTEAVAVTQEVGAFVQHYDEVVGGV